MYPNRLVVYTIWIVAAAGLAGCQQPAQKAPVVREPLTSLQTERLLNDVQAIQELADQGQSGAVKAAFDQLKAELPQIAQFDLSAFADAELAYARRQYRRAARAYQQVLDDYSDSELRPLALQRLYQIGLLYAKGRMVFDMLIFRIRGYDLGVKLLERVSEEVGLEDPNGLGVKAALEVAQSYEARQMYEQASLKWSEIAAVWDSGDLGRQALLGMANNKLACYRQHAPHRRHLYNGAHLVAARTYYLRLKALYPDEAQRIGVDQIVAQIDEDLALRQLAIARYYHRTGHRQAANMYLDMIVRSLPGSRAAQKANQWLEAGRPAGPVAP